MNKLWVAVTKGAKHGFTAGLASASATLLAGGLNPKLVGLSFVGGFLAGIGVNVPAIQNAPQS